MKIKGNLWGKFTAILIILVFIFGCKVNAKTQNDISKQILQNTKSQIIQMGSSVSYKTNFFGKNQCIKWLKEMNLYNPYSNKIRSNELNNKIIKDDGTNYCVEFKKDNIEGYIESYKMLDNYKISINVDMKIKNKLNFMQQKIINSMSSKNNCYKYIKAKSKMKNINNISKEIKSILVKNRAKNIDCIKVNKSLSTTAFIKNLNYIVDNNEKINFNCAACEYSDGNYIIIGTPIISIAY